MTAAVITFDLWTATSNQPGASFGSEGFDVDVQFMVDGKWQDAQPFYVDSDSDVILSTGSTFSKTFQAAAIP